MNNILMLMKYKYTLTKENQEILNYIYLTNRTNILLRIYYYLKSKVYRQNFLESVLVFISFIFLKSK